MEPLRHLNRRGFGAVIFRRLSTQITNEGGLWDTSESLYPSLGLMGMESRLKWEHPDTGVNIKFAHLQYEKDKYSWQGSQIAMIGFDELTHFSKSQFLYLMGRNRSMSGVKPYIRATTNPDPDSWVADVIAWWINQDETSPEWGQPIPERAGVVRWFIHVNDEFVWADKPEQLLKHYPDQLPKSFTFIPAKLEDNQILMKTDPGYKANLMALSRIDRIRLLGGNWSIRASAGHFFKQTWFEQIEAPVRPVKLRVRYWDLAGTELEEGKGGEDDRGPAWTVGTLMSMLPDGTFVIEDVIRERLSPFGVENLLTNTASQDGNDVYQVIERDPGQAGKFQGKHLARLLAGHRVHITPVPRSSKEDRAKTFSAQCEAGNVKIVRGNWNRAWYSELEQFPDGLFADQVDSGSGAFRFLIGHNDRRRRAPSHTQGLFSTT